jgi:Family of unknown function (DUF5681)
MAPGKTTAGNTGRNTAGLKPWKPGQSGNPSGRPKRKPLTDAYAAILEKRIPAAVAHKLQLIGRPTYAQVIAMALAQEAIKGKVNAAAEMADRVEGRIGQPGDSGENPFHLHIEDVRNELIAALDRRADQRTPEA